MFNNPYTYMEAEKTEEEEPEPKILEYKLDVEKANDVIDVFGNEEVLDVFEAEEINVFEPEKPQKEKKIVDAKLENKLNKIKKKNKNKK
jgi:hypothetical protein